MIKKKTKQKTNSRNEEVAMVFTSLVGYSHQKKVPKGWLHLISHVVFKSFFGKFIRKSTKSDRSHFLNLKGSRNHSS